jgi:Suppressor of fused protein (SUFU)
MSDEIGEGGSRIIRHQPHERELVPAADEPELVEALGSHVERHIGDFTVFHEIVSDLVHIDLFVARPTNDRPRTTVVTCGMSALPMAAPEGMDEFRYAELVLALPPDWPLSQDAFEAESVYWPFRLLKTLARLPHEYATWLYFGHTIPNGDPAMPYSSGTELCGVLLWPPALVPESFARLDLSGGRPVHFYGVFPLHAEEMELKLKKGADALVGLLADAGVTELVNPERPSMVTPKRGFFRR